MLTLQHKTELTQFLSWALILQAPVQAQTHVLAWSPCEDKGACCVELLAGLGPCFMCFWGISPSVQEGM